MSDNYQDDTPRIQIITQRGRPGDSLDFDFDGVISQYCYGIMNFHLDYSGLDGEVGKEGRVKVLKVALSDSGKSGKRITVEVDADMSDNDDEGIDNQKSYVDVSCIASIYGTIDSLTLQNTKSIDNGSSSDSIAVGDNPSYYSAFLSGFDFDADDGQKVESLELGASTNLSTPDLTVQATAVLTEHKDTVTDGSIAAAVVACTATDGVIVTRLLNQSDETTLTFTDSSGAQVKLSYATAFLTTSEFEMPDGDDNYVTYFAAGCDSCTVSDDGLSVTVGSIGTVMGNYDSDGNETDYVPESSKTQVWVIGVVDNS